MRGLLQITALAIVFATAPNVLPIGGEDPGMVGAAWADDGDDGGGDDGPGGENRGGGRSGGGVSGGSGSGDFMRDLRSIFKGKQSRQNRSSTRRQAAPAPIPRPVRAPDEIVARDLSSEDTAALVALGYTVLEETELATLNTTLRRLEVPAGVGLDDARAAIRALPSGEAADFNHYYRSEAENIASVGFPQDGAARCEGMHCGARALINWPDGLGPEGCGLPVRLGIVDTGLNPDHEALQSSGIELTRVAPEDYIPSSAVHGTAVAAILVGDPASRAPGLLPGMPLVAVDAFHKQSGDERADVFTLIRALDTLAEADVQIINLSLAGPPNDVLAATMAQLTGMRGITVVAAAGNGGPNAEPAYPAAYDGVIAVTAVDRNSAVYRRAGRGPHVDLAAPGVEVWTAASVKGARWKTGTSFAVPFVSAAAALWLQHDPALTPEEIRARLAGSARDLGAEGRDEIFGDGLIDLGGACPGQAVFHPASAN